MLFFVLPFGIEKPGSRTSQEYAAAPKAVSWKKKFLIAAALALIATIGLAAIIDSGLIDVRNLT